VVKGEIYTVDTSNIGSQRFEPLHDLSFIVK